MGTQIMFSKFTTSYNVIFNLSKFGVVKLRRNKVDFINDARYVLRPTKYSAFEVLENMLSERTTDLGVGVLLARNPQCVTRNAEEVLTSTEYLKRWAMKKRLNLERPMIGSEEGVVLETVSDGEDSTCVQQNDTPIYVPENNIMKDSDSSLESSSDISSNDFKTQHYASIRETIETMCVSHMQNMDHKQVTNPFRVPYETTFLFVKSKILFPDEWYIPTLFVSKYMNIHEAANSITHDILHLNDEKATIASPFPSVSVTENIPKDHPLYEKLKKKISIFIYRATYHSHSEMLDYDTEIIQDVKWLTASEAKHALKPSFYKKLSTIF